MSVAPYTLLQAIELQEEVGLFWEGRGGWPTTVPYPYTLKLCVYIASSLLIQVLSNPESRELHGYDSVVVLTLLINYRKYEVCILVRGPSMGQVLGKGLGFILGKG